MKEKLDIMISWGNTQWLFDFMYVLSQINEKYFSDSGSTSTTSFYYFSQEQKIGPL